MQNSISHSFEVDVQQSDTGLELAYRMQLSSLRGIERLFISLSTLLSLFCSYLALDQRDLLWLLPAAGLIVYPAYTILVRCVNKWYISLDDEDVIISSGPIPAGADKLLMRSMIDTIYSRESEDHVDLSARLIDGRVIHLVRNLPVDIGEFVYDQIEDFINNYSTDDETAEFPTPPELMTA